MLVRVRGSLNRGSRISELENEVLGRERGACRWTGRCEVTGPG